jgi:hypothetical protein
MFWLYQSRQEAMYDLSRLLSMRLCAHEAQSDAHVDEQVAHYPHKIERETAAAHVRRVHLAK